MLRSFWKYLKEENKFGGGDTDMQSLYQPGLVKKVANPYVRDSSDGVIMAKDNGVKTATPIEVKG